VALPPIRLALLVACVALARPGRAQTESPAAPPPSPPPARGWEAPERFLAAWLRGAAFFPAASSLQDARIQPAVGIGVGVRPLPFLTAEAEGGWTSRDYASPGAVAGRATLSSRAVTLGVRVHHPLLGLEPSAFGGLVLMRSVLEVPAAAGTVDAEAALSTGFAVGLALDLPIGSNFAVGLDWRWLRISGRFDRLGGGTLALGGHALGALVRLYWP
jgi:hypothetical protein